MSGSRSFLSRWLPWVQFHTDAAASTRFAEACAADWDQGRAVRFTIRERATRTLVGVVGLEACVHLHRSCELGYWLRREATRRGFMTEAARAALDFAFKASWARTAFAWPRRPKTTPRSTSSGASDFASRASPERPSGATDAGSTTPSSRCCRPTEHLASPFDDAFSRRVVGHQRLRCRLGEVLDAVSFFGQVCGARSRWARYAGAFALGGGCACPRVLVLRPDRRRHEPVRVADRLHAVPRHDLPGRGCATTVRPRPPTATTRATATTTARTPSASRDTHLCVQASSRRSARASSR